MRVWLVDEKSDGASGLQAALKQLADSPGSGLTFLGVAPYRSDFATAMRSLMPDLIVIHEPAWPEESAVQEALGLGPGVVVATAAEHSERFRALAELYPLVLIPAGSGPEVLGLALLSARGGQRRQAQWKGEVAGLQQRLSDRIIIERAKGILVQRLGIPEEEAYKRLRVLSRRQRRQIRDIAQSLVDTQYLLTPAEINGFGEHAGPNHDSPEPEESRPRFS
jgi:response regulator NasT